MDRFAERLAFDFPKRAQAATSAALNRTAHACELLAKRELRSRFVLRNRWSVGSIKSTRTPPSRAIDQQFTIAGSKSPYLALQAVGGRLDRSKEGRRITTSHGSKEGAVARPRRKLARGRFANRNIKLKKQKRAKGSKSQKQAIQIAIARKKGQKFIFMDYGGDSKGIVNVLKRKVRMVHRFLERPVSVKATNWFEPAVKTSRNTAPIVFRKELERTFRP